jgi:hypothetical protein
MSYLKVLASDSMEGRESGQPGGVKAEEYIAAKLREWGLKPAGDNETFFQNITLEHRHVEEGVVLEIVADRPLFLYSPLIEGEYRVVRAGKTFLFGVDLS